MSATKVGIAASAAVAAAMLALGPPPVAAQAAPAAAPALFQHAFRLDAAGVAVATIEASCAGCDWRAAGREAAALVLRVDGRYSQHLFLVRGAERAGYRVALGPLDPGRHTLAVSLDGALTPAAARQVRIAGASVTPAPLAETAAFAHAPILYARPDTLGRFSDVPLVMWYETDARPDGVALRYSVVFSNEDGGTASDKLMATWGRLTDIEFVYGVALDADGRARDETFQGPEHQLLPFGGGHEGDRPLLYVVTRNNMVSDAAREVDGVPGQATVRFAPAPVRFDLGGTSREAVMDANPWTYRVSVREARREGRVDENATPGQRSVPDPRRFATLEACAPAEDATLAFSLAVRAADGRTRWFDSDGGLTEFRIQRRPHEFPNGCFRGAVALPPGTRAAEIVALRLRAFTRIAGKDEPPLAKGSGRARVERVNRLFLLGEDDLPGPNLFSWQGDAPLEPEGPPLELRIR